MNSFATVNLPANQRRDRDSPCIFYFKDLQEFYSVRDAISILYPNAFYISRKFQASLQAQNIVGQYEPIGAAWCLLKSYDSNAENTDFANDVNFFLK